VSAYEERLRDRFWSKVNKKASNGCWEWTGSLSTSGYSRIWACGKLVAAHRLSWVWANGKIPARLFVLHKCDNRSCVNPDHLFLGTQKENVQDCIRKGRFVGNVDGNPSTRLRVSDGYVRCPTCEAFLPKESFFKDLRSQSHCCSGHCKKCHTIYARVYRAKVKVKRLAKVE